MRRMRKLTTLCVFASAGLALLTGCPSTDSRTSNQGGGSVLTAGAKIAGEQMSSLTPDEVQILVDLVSDRVAEFDIALSDEEAADAVDFLREYNINSVADIQALVEQFENDPDSIVIPDSILALIESQGVAV